VFAVDGRLLLIVHAVCPYHTHHTQSVLVYWCYPVENRSSRPSTLDNGTPHEGAIAPRSRHVYEPGNCIWLSHFMSHSRSSSGLTGFSTCVPAQVGASRLQSTIPLSLVAAVAVKVSHVSPPAANHHLSPVTDGIPHADVIHALRTNRITHQLAKRPSWQQRGTCCSRASRSYPPLTKALW
jgi:hypothetical protein